MTHLQSIARPHRIERETKAQSTSSEIAATGSSSAGAAGAGCAGARRASTATTKAAPTSTTARCNPDICTLEEFNNGKKKRTNALNHSRVLKTSRNPSSRRQPSDSNARAHGGDISAMSLVCPRHSLYVNTIQYNTIQYNTIQYNTIQYNTIQYNTIQYNFSKGTCAEHQHQETSTTKQHQHE